ncbi:MAG: class I SAM-dependent methyltransferase [Candidatus Omnitrophica bacterium]|nr:class I SAM-dependent methyltransferase [Candidatus Omnitrophota bacterium]
MLDKLYFWIHRKLSRPDEQGEYSAGVWQNAVRDKVMALSADAAGKVLEVGCGEGLLLLKLAGLKPKLDIYGIDIWNDILVRAQIKLDKNNIQNVKLTQADAAKLPFSDDFFDRVICINVFFNLPREEMVLQTIKEISRVVRRNAKIIVDIRNSFNPLLYLKYKFAKYYDPTVKDLPLRTYSYKKIVKYLEMNNFKVIKKIEIGFPYNNLAPIFVIQAQRI